MKTPEEIKKVLECRSRHLGEECNMECKSCDVYVNGRFSEFFKDALAYINQLEQRIAQAEMERDAAVECIEKAYETMDRVVHKPEGTIQNLREGRKIIYDYCAVKWRGVYEENSKEGEVNEGRT